MKKILIILFIILLGILFYLEKRVQVLPAEPAPLDMLEEDISEEPQIDSRDTQNIETTGLLQEESDCSIIDNFTSEAPSLRWFTVNDGVMGGRSQGVASVEQGTLVHTGFIDTNGGGFSNVSARLPKGVLVGYNRVKIRLNTYGRGYSISFDDARYRGVSHQAPIPIGPLDSWHEVFINFDQTVPTIFSRRVNSKPFLASTIDELSLSLGDGMDGPFRMEVDWIKACR